MKTNVIQVNLNLTEIGLKRFQTTPAFKILHGNQLIHLKVGDNLINVNHTTWGNLQRLVSNDSINMKVEKV